MNFITIIIIIALLLAVIFYIYKKKFARHEVSRTIQEDPGQQQTYEKKKVDEDEVKSLTMEEKIELSWEFLTRITQEIMDKFSSQEKEQVHDAGKTLVKHGGQYQHDVTGEAKTNRKLVAKAKTKKKKSTGGVGR